MSLRCFELRATAGEIHSVQHPTSFGRYEVRAVLGRGGMGLVYLAFDPLIGREVAIKAIHRLPALDDADTDEMRRRLENEYRAAGTLSHPHVVTILDVGHEDDVSFIAMEKVDGPSLAALHTGGEGLTAEELCPILEQVASALDYAHAQGVVHRDIKPSNILISADGTAKVSDFGIAKLAWEDATKSGNVFGTPWYMSPEQIRSGVVSGASDQFALAVVAYEMLAGQRPFQGDDPASVLYKVVHEPPLAPRLLHGSLPAAVDHVLLRGLAKRAEDRFPSCSEFAAALSDACLGRDSGGHTIALPPVRNLADIHQAPTVASAVPALPARIRKPALRVLRRFPAWLWWLGAFLMGALVLTTISRSWDARSDLAPEAAYAEALRVEPMSSARVEQLLEVTSNPPGADIWVDGLPTGNATPAEISLQGLEGERVYVSLRRRGLVVAETSIVLGAPSQPVWSSQLVTIPTPRPRPTPRAAPTPSVAAAAPVSTPELCRTVIVDVVPDDVRVLLDGEETELTSPVQIDVHPGATLRLERTGFEAWERVFSATEVAAADHPLEYRVILMPTKPLGEIDERLATARVGVAIEAPRQLISQDPVYPEDVEPGTSGFGVYEVVLDPHGRVAQVTTLRGVSPEIDDAAIRSILVSRYEPSHYKGKPVNVIMSVTMFYPPR